MKNSILKGQLLLIFLYIMLVWPCSILIISSQTFCSTTDTLFYFWAALYLWLMTNIPPPWEQWWGDYTGCCPGRLTLLHWFLVLFFPFLYVLVAVLQCHSVRAAGKHHLRFSFEILIAVSRSPINLTLINIFQLLTLKSLRAESLLLKLLPKSWLKIK